MTASKLVAPARLDRVQLLFAVLSALASASVDAQDTNSQPYELGEVVVTATAPPVEQSSTVREITSDEIENSGARTLDEAIEMVPGVNVATRADGTPRIDFRGRRTRHVKLLINGIPFNSAADGQFDPTLIPTEQIARIKVTTGAQSQLYGDNGLGAVVNLITKQAFDGKHGDLITEVGTGNSRRVVGTFTAGNNKFGLLLSAGHQERAGFDLADDFRATLLEGGGLRENSDLRRETFYANGTYTPSNNLELGMTFNFVDGDHGIPSSVLDPTKDPFAQAARNERVDKERAYYAQVSADYTPPGPWSHRAWAYVSQMQEVTNRYSDGTLRTFEDPTIFGTFSNDADSRTLGAHAQSEYKDRWGGTLSFMAEARQESLAEECSVRDVPRLVATGTTAAAPTAATIDYTFTTTNLSGATTSTGTNAPVARLTLTDRTGGGVDFSLTDLAGNNFGAGSFLSRLFLNVNPGVDTSTWGFSNAAGSQASLGGVDFANTEVVDGYLYPIRVNFQRPGGAGGTADPLLQGDTAQFLFSQGSVADLIGTSVARSGGGASNMFSAIGFRGADPSGFWGVSSIDVIGIGPTPRVNVQAPAVTLGAGTGSSGQPVSSATTSCDGGGGGGEDSTPVGPIPGFEFDVRKLTQDHAIDAVSFAAEYGIEPFKGWGANVGVGQHFLLRDGADDIGAMTFSIGAYHDLTDSTRVRASVGQKVRTPSVSQLYSFRGGNAGLKYEQALGYEAGVHQQLGARASADVVVYHDDVSDMIQRDQDTGLQENVSEVRFQGLEFTADANPFDHLGLRLSYSLVDSRDLSPGTVRKEIQNVPHDTVGVQANYDCCAGLKAYLSWLYVANQVFYARGGSPLKGQLDPYGVMNFKLERSLFHNHAGVFIGADNLLDENYQESYGFPQAGRFIFGGVKLQL